MRSSFFKNKGIALKANGRGRIIVAALVLWIVLQTFSLSSAMNAPGSPGLPSVWAPAQKDFLGTSASQTSRVYFTGAEGVLTEVFYPTIDTVQNVDLQFMVTDAGNAWGDEERTQQHTVSLINKRALLWQAVTTANNGRWRITKKIFTDPGRNSLIERVVFQTLEPGKKIGDYNLYILNNPAINNSGGGSDNPGGADNSRTMTVGGRTMLVASEPNSTSSALAISLPWKVVEGNLMVSNGFVGKNDGFTDLFGGISDKIMDWRFDAALGGNVAQMGWIDLGVSNDDSIALDVVLSFGKNENEAAAAANGTLKNG